MSQLRFAWILLFSILASLSAFFPAYSSDLKPLAVMDLKPVKVDEGTVQALSIILRDEIHKYGKYEVLSQEDLEAIAERESIQMKIGCEDENLQCLLDFGRKIGTEFMVAGTVSKIGSLYSISLRMLDTRGNDAGLQKRVSKRCECNEVQLVQTIVVLAEELVGEKPKVVEAKPTPKPSKPAAPQKKTPTEQVSAKPVGTDKAVVATDRHFQKYDNGIVYDTNTGLEWYLGPDKSTSWNAAKAWVEGLNVEGGGWRLPNMDELQKLYVKGVGTRNMTPLLQTSGWDVWSGEKRNSSFAWRFGFRDGLRGWSGIAGYANTFRAIAVRSRSLSTAALSGKEKIKLASVSPEVIRSQIVATDRHFEKLANGIVYDKNSGLEWYAGPDKGANWYEAKRWVGNLSVDGGGWRMPTLSELESLYSLNTGSRNMSPLLETSGWWMWSGEKKERSNDAWLLRFTQGDRYWFKGYETSSNIRAFAVRSRK